MSWPGGSACWCPSWWWPPRRGIGRHEPDPEIQQLLTASSARISAWTSCLARSASTRIGWAPERELASRVLWFDALVGNVDRSWRNPNLLLWHGELWLIDHGAALHFQPPWASAGRAVDRVYDAGDHVLAPYATKLEPPTRRSRRWSPPNCSARSWRWCRTIGSTTSRVSTASRRCERRTSITWLARVPPRGSGSAAAA